MEIVRPFFSPSQDVPNQHIFNFPKRLGDGTICFDKFSSGLGLLYMCVTPTRPISLNVEMLGGTCGISFNLTGYSELHSIDHKQILLSKAATSTHYVYPNTQVLEEKISTAIKSKVSILFDKETLMDFANEDEEAFLPFVKGLQCQIPVSGQGKIAPEIRRSLNQIIDCPYGGKTRALFLEGKVMEIFAYKLDELREKGKGIPRQPPISASDIERIHYAAELLLADPINPPDLTGLAGQIGMSRSKFYKHFKVVFEHSPMDHLRKHRLQVARQLLQQRDHNVTEVAFAVGFNSLSYFTRTFTTEFGLSPRQII